MRLVCTNCVLLDGGFNGVWGNNEMSKVVDNHTLARSFVQEQELAPSRHHILQAPAALPRAHHPCFYVDVESGVQSHWALSTLIVTIYPKHSCVQNLN